MASCEMHSCIEIAMTNQHLKYLKYDVMSDMILRIINQVSHNVYRVFWSVADRHFANPRMIQIFRFRSNTVTLIYASYV